MITALEPSSNLDSRLLHHTSFSSAMWIYSVENLFRLVSSLPLPLTKTVLSAGENELQSKLYLAPALGFLRLGGILTGTSLHGHSRAQSK